MKTTLLTMTGLLAALLATPPATAADRSGNTADRSPIQALLKKGLADVERQDFTAAITKFSKAASLSPESRALFLLGYAHAQRGSRSAVPSAADKQDAQEAVSAYSQAMAADPGLKVIADPSRFYRSLAWSYETVQDFDRAAAAYRSAMAAAPKNPMIPLNLARAYSRLGQPAKAAESLGASLERARQIGQEELILKTLRGNPRYSSMLAYPDVAAVAGDPAASQPVIAQAAPASRDEELRDAVKDQGPALARELAAAPLPDPAVMDALAAGDDNFKFRQYRTAINAYDTAARLDGKAQALSPVQRSILYERMGAAYNRLGLCEDAVLPLQRSLQAMPNNAAANYQLALAYSVSGRFNEALRALAGTFDSAPSRAELRKYLILAKSDSEFEPVRDLAGFAGLVGRTEDLLARR
ncbi:MAG: tetratricopeptide repeat protein [Elusimicrobia bacterium]|nr:tetratricopeptide repeat protein [Elusimicrobiota bacterium]